MMEPQPDLKQPEGCFLIYKSKKPRETLTFAFRYAILKDIIIFLIV